MFQKPTAASLAKKFPRIYEILSSTAMFTIVRHLLSEPAESVPKPHTLSFVTSALILFHLYLDFPRDLHTSDFPIKFLYAFLIAPMVPTTPAQLILDLKTPYLQSTKVSTQVMLPVFILLNMATDRASCLTRRIATLYGTTRITGAPVTYLRSIQ